MDRGSNGRLTLDIYPLGDSGFNEDDGTSNDYLEGGFATTLFSCRESGDRIEVTVNPIQGRYEGLLKEREYQLVIHTRRAPGSVSLNGVGLHQTESLPGWQRDGGHVVVRVSFTAATSAQSRVELRF